MSQITPIIISLSEANRDLGKAIEDFAFHTDNSQFISAAVELGRIEELGNKVAEICKLAKDPFWQISRT